MFRPELAVDVVAAFLADRFGEVTDLEAIGGGEWSQAFSFRAEQRDRVIRFGQFPEDYAKDRVAAGFAGPDLPIPRILELGAAFDGAFAISERAFGHGFDGLSEAGYRRVLPALFRTLDGLRRADVSGSSGYGMWRPALSWKRSYVSSCATRSKPSLSSTATLCRFPCVTPAKMSVAPSDERA